MSLAAILRTGRGDCVAFTKTWQWDTGHSHWDGNHTPRVSGTADEVLCVGSASEETVREEGQTLDEVGEQRQEGREAETSDTMMLFLRLPCQGTLGTWHCLLGEADVCFLLTSSKAA